jgi:hypothetical protein
MSVAKLIGKIHGDDLFWEMVKLVGYGAFRTFELASRMKPLVEKYGPKKVSAAMFELLQHVGWITQLNPHARQAAVSCLGPAPENWESWYTGLDGKPLPRPPHHQTPPEIPKPEPDPILDGLTRKTATELDMTLRQSQAALKGEKEHLRQLAEETIPRVESEMVRRGEAIPPEEKEEPKSEEAPKKKRTKKKEE